MSKNIQQDSYALTLLQQWEEAQLEDPELVQLLTEKVTPLFLQTEDAFIRQGLSFLQELEEFTLLHVFDVLTGVFEVQRSFDEQKNRIEQTVYTEIMQEAEEYKDQVNIGLWSGILFRLLSKTEWNQFDADQQEMLWEESKRMVPMPRGTFWMGGLDEKARPQEKPRHKVLLSTPFAMGKYQVSQRLWRQVMGRNPSKQIMSEHPASSCFPVENVSWYDCIEFCNRLSKIEGLEPAYIRNGNEVRCNFDAYGYRLPTEAEWEYCARGGEYHMYAGSDDVEEVGWVLRNANRQRMRVGQKKSNGFGLYDMSGNVLEWCWDWYGKEYYQYSPEENPTGPREGAVKITRGGRNDYSKDASVHYRDDRSGYMKNGYTGLRLARTLPSIAE